MSRRARVQRRRTSRVALAVLDDRPDAYLQPRRRCERFFLPNAGFHCDASYASKAA